MTSTPAPVRQARVDIDRPKSRVVKPSRSRHWPITADPWNPWKTLVEDYPELKVITSHELPPSILGCLHGTRIWLCKTLDGVARTCTLAHELIHYERQIFPTDPVKRLHEERIVEELTARRLIPFDDLCRVMLQSPNSATDWWAWHLRVELKTLDARLVTLSPVERAALEQIRGGPLPATLSGTLWDKQECSTSLQDLRDFLGEVQRA